MIARIIIEGPDCSGKSTLVDRIKNELRWDAKHLHHKDGNQFERYAKEYLTNERIVFDRSHFSEVVYGTMWRGGNPFSEEELKILNQISRTNTIIILTCPETEVLEKRYSTRGYKQQIKPEELKKSRDLFLNVFQNVPHILYKSESYDELESLVNYVKKSVTGEKQKFYLAGPVGYGKDGTDWKEKLKQILRKNGHTVYDPIENDGKYPLIPKMNKLKEESKKNFKEIKQIMQNVFTDDCEFIKESDYLLCYFKGRAYGTISEQGIAYFANKFFNKKVKTISIFDESFIPDEWVLCCSDYIFFSTEECEKFLESEFK